MELRRWQAEALPLLLRTLRRGDRALLSACTGAGKSILVAALLDDVLSTMRPGWACVVTVPTRSLVEQLAATLRAYLSVPVGRWYDRHKERGTVRVCCLPSLSSLIDDLEAEGLRCALWIGDEVHRAEAPGVISDLERLAPARWLGVTATPYRSHTGLTHWPELTYRYDMGRAFDEGVLVRPRVIVPVVGDGEDDDPVTVMLAMLRRRPEIGGPMVWSAASIPEAEERAARLGWLAYHSKMADGARVAAIEQLRTGQTPGLVHVRALSEGVDLPWLRTIGLGTRHSRTRVGLIQEVGRALRCHPGKDAAWILDPLRLMSTFDLEEIGQLIQAADDPDADEEERERKEQEEREEVERIARADLIRRVSEARALVEELRFAAPTEAGDVHPETIAEIERHEKDLRWIARRHQEHVRALFDARRSLDEGTARTLARLLTVARARVGDHMRRGGGWANAPRLDLGEPSPPAPRCRRCGSVSEWQRSRGGILAWCPSCDAHPTATGAAQPGNRIAVPAALFVAPHALPERP